MSSEAALDADNPTISITSQSDDGGITAIPKRSKRKGGGAGLSMTPVDRDDLENIRVPRPAGVPEWGTIQSKDDAPIKGQRKEDRWV